MEANGQCIKPSAWLPPGHDPGAASGEATTARQQGSWPSTFWLSMSSLEQSDAAAKSAAPFSCKPMRCKCVAERASEKRVQSGRPGPWPGDSCVTTPFRAGSRRRSPRRDVMRSSPTGSRRHGSDHCDHGGHGGHGDHGAGRGGPLTRRRREPGSGIHQGGRVGQNKQSCELTEFCTRTSRGTSGPARNSILASLPFSDDY